MKYRRYRMEMPSTGKLTGSPKSTGSINEPLASTATDTDSTSGNSSPTLNPPSEDDRPLVLWRPTPILIDPSDVELSTLLCSLLPLSSLLATQILYRMMTDQPVTVEEAAFANRIEQVFLTVRLKSVGNTIPQEKEEEDKGGINLNAVDIPTVA